MKTKLIEILSWALVRRLLVTAVCVGGAFVAHASVWEDMQADLAAGLVKFDGGETNWVDGDLVITYTNVTDGGKLVLPKAATARILAVGGGGGGGRVTYTTKRGAGAGGGGGGVVETDGLILKGEYTITIGAGGVAGEGGTNVANPGGNGGDTFFKQGSADVITPAIGGGGGGASSDGLFGGSGGGGSKAYNGTRSGTNRVGGAGVQLQGNKGGDGTQLLGGAGGGGAGTEGATPTGTSSGAKGGDGVSCNITGVEEYYGGGGGGGNLSNSMTGLSEGGEGGGGKGLGGNTARHVSADEILKVNGVDGLGGGGGGGGSYETAVAGHGGCGTLIVRVTVYLKEGVKIPELTSGLVFNNEEQHAFDQDDPNRAFYTIEGTESAANAGNYSFTATLKSGLEWADGKTEPRTFNWTISKKVVTVPVARTGLVYDGTSQIGHTNSVPSDMSFYEVTDGEKTDAGTYKFTATLKYDSSNVEWADGVTLVEDIVWSIATKKIPDPVFTTEFTYAPGVVNVALPESENYNRLGTFKAIDAGTYNCTAQLKNVDGQVNYEWVSGGSADQNRIWVIKKTMNEISGLSLLDWQEGATASSPTVTSVKYGQTSAVRYSYRVVGATDWSATQPTEAGAYEVRAFIAEDSNWFEAEAVSAFRIWRHPSEEYTDFIDITNTVFGAVDVKISEDKMPGFSYVRTSGQKNDSFRFIYSPTDDSKDDVLLNYSNLNWNASGESSVRVCLPESANAVSPIRMYWHEKVEGPTSLNYPGEASVAQGGDAGDYGLVNSNGVWINYWVKEPSISQTSWDEGATPGEISEGELRVGNVVVTYRKLPRGFEVSDMPTNSGTYAAIFRMADLGSDYTLLGGAHQFEYEVLGSNPFTSVGDTASGRILLVNDDIGGDIGYGDREPITGQGYWVTEAAEFGTYWEHSGETYTGSGSYNYIQKGRTHTLYVRDGESSEGRRVVWHLVNAYIGNVYSSGRRGMFSNSMNYLPWSATSKKMSSDELINGKTNEVANIILMNTTNACVYSSCFTNGIGTIYFDAVNGYVEKAQEDQFNLVVEVATETVSGDAPIDENCGDNYERLDGKWRPVNIIPLVKNGADEFLTGEATNEIDLVELLGTAGGGKSDKFIRGCARLNLHCPVRFRIRRSSIYYEGTVAVGEDDIKGFLLLDNIIASPPPMYANMKPAGYYDETRVGKQVLGQECSFSDAFPAATATDLKARARAEKVVTAGVTVPDVNFISSARMNYRWRYLNQQFYPKDGSWKTVYLDPEAEDFVSVDSLQLPGQEGDLEFFYDFTMQAPAYSYQDYSGCGVARPTGDYSEEVRFRTNRLERAEWLPSLGTNWFVRLRAGASDYRNFTIETKLSEDGEVTRTEMEVVGSHTWRGFVPTLDASAGGIYYRLKSEIPVDASAAVLNCTTNWWVADRELKSLPDSPSVEEGTSTSWAHMPCDASTGYLMLQLDDQTKTLTITHADYQNFKTWNDAVSPEGQFTGSSTQNDKKSGTSPKMKEYREAFGTWTDTPETDPGWKETFAGVTAQSDVGGYHSYEEFSSAISPNGWTAGPGMWVAKWYRPSKDDAAFEHAGLAYQMEGCGKGYLQKITSSVDARGIGSVSFTARLAQTIDFYDFSYSEAEAPKTMTDYTFFTKAAFDEKSNRAFSGNASLSVVAFYRAKEGCYEARWEQLDGTYDTTTTAFTGADPSWQRLCLYRWAKNSRGYVDCELIGAITNGVKTTINGKVIDLNGDNAIKVPSTTESTKKALGFYIAAKAETDKTLVVVGVQYDKKKDGENVGGLDPSASADTAKSWVCISYADTSENRLKSGAYGVLSANCEALFINPQVYLKFPQYASTDKIDPATITTNTPCYGSGIATVFPVSPSSCKSDIEGDNWAIDENRMEQLLEQLSDGKDIYGVRAKTDISQDVEIQFATKGQTDWKTVATRTVDNFGSAGKAGTTFTIPFYETEDHSIQIKTAGPSDSVRTDVVLTDISFTQWRGDNYGEGDTTAYAVGESSSGYPSNFVFTSGIITGNRVKLSAKRTQEGTPCSIRSPFMDGGENWDRTKRGQGIGMIAFNYVNAQSNVNLLVQVATNGLRKGQDIRNVTKSVSESSWTTVTNFDFSACTEDELRSGMKSVYIGLHGVIGLVRIALDPAMVAAVADETNSANFGEIEITKVLVRDEPTLDLSSWWGWNLRTLNYSDAYDGGLRTYLPDAVQDVDYLGLSLALNNSTVEDVSIDDQEVIKQHMPFVQTPTFTSNIVGEISFRARVYTTNTVGFVSSEPAEIQLYGATVGTEGDDTKWVALERFIVSNTLYTVYSYKSQSEKYSAFRLAVTGVENVLYPGASPTKGTEPVRVLIDEVMVCEAVRPTMGFVYVYPFRDGLEDDKVCTNIFTCDAQPLIGEAWTVQAQIEKRQLPDEIDFTTKKPRVFFYWYDRTSPWGFENWRGRSDAKCAELSLAEGESLIFRGSMLNSPGAVVEASDDAPQVIQYSAEVVFSDLTGSEQTNVLKSGEWTRPDWYAPIDYNKRWNSFSAYTILDTIAPKRVWFNEVNVWDGRSGYTYFAETNQYIEIAAPYAQALDNWRVEYIDEYYQTNRLFTFSSSETGVGYIPSTKSYTATSDYLTNDYVFLTAQSPETRDAKRWDSVPGAIDGTWRQYGSSGSGVLTSTRPIALRLIRPSQIVEEEIVLEGTNWYKNTRYEKARSATNYLATLSAAMPESKFVYVGCEEDSPTGIPNDKSLSVLTGIGSTSNDWSNIVQTPGRVNKGQIIPLGYVLYPNGELMVVRVQVDENGKILQTFADVVDSTQAAMAMTRRGGEGTNILYKVADWWEIKSITTNGVLAADFVGRTGNVTFNIGAGQSNNVTVVALAQPRKDLREEYGLDDSNPYTPAVMDWLERGKNYWGEDFENPGEIHVGKFRDLAGTFETNLTLTSMYWLDMDPTKEGGVFRAGVSDVVGPIVHGLTNPPVTTNVRLQVKMMLTNEVDSTAAVYAPYVLRGLTPGETSADGGSWTSVTFKVVAWHLSDSDYTAPLRWFTFQPDETKPNRSASFEDDYTSMIDVWDPQDEAAAIWTRGWSQFSRASIFYKWSIDSRIAPITVEKLKPESTYPDD